MAIPGQTSDRRPQPRHHFRAEGGQRREAVEFARRLRTRAFRTQGCQLVGPDGERIDVPEQVFRALKLVAEVLARGDALTILPVGQELTTQQAANMLNVSRQYLVRLLEDGKIPFKRTGTHRRVLADDVLRYKQLRDEERYSALDELSVLSQAADGYPELE